VAFLKTGSAYYAPSAAAVEMVEAMVLDRKRILPCSAWLQGEFGLRDVFCGVPCKLGRKGLEKVVEIELTDQERADLHKSAEAVRGMQAVVDG
jgi:malate dehydrogenase